MAENLAGLVLVPAEAGGDNRGHGPRRVPRKEGETTLTPRETEVLGLLAEGLSTTAVAARLSISRVTVRNHVQRILSKLSSHSRLEAVAMAHRLGLLARAVFRNE